MVTFDNFYKALDEDQIAQAHAANYNFDSPAALDMDEEFKTIENLL